MQLWISIYNDEKKIMVEANEGQKCAQSTYVNGVGEHFMYLITILDLIYLIEILDFICLMKIIDFFFLKKKNLRFYISYKI